MPKQPVVTFYFDPVSPYVWLAAGAIGRIEAAGAEVELKPVLFAGLLNAHGQKGPAEIAAKRLYTFRDVMRQARQQGLVFKGTPGHPFNPLLALRMCVAITSQDERRRFLLAVLRAGWEGGEDISDRAILERVAGECGLDGAVLLEAAQQPAVKMALAANTEQAIADGVFGVPTFRVDDELFWGGDRVEALLAHLDGGRIDENALADFLARPPLAERKGR